MCGFAAHAQQVSLKVSKDTVTIMNAELVLQNSSQQKGGFLYNKDNGKTSFQPVGKALQFKVGAPNYPAAGVSSFSDSSLIGKYIKVWRNGLLQYPDYTSGIAVDPETGTITFYPSLAANELIFIEGITGYADVERSTAALAGSNIKALYAGVFDNGNNTFTLRWASNHTNLYNYPRFIGIGSSMLAGEGLAAPNRLGDRIGAWLNGSTIFPIWANYALAGLNSNAVVPTILNGTNGRNIDAALAANPDIIFVSLPTQDAIDLSVAQSMANLRMFDEIAIASGVPVIFETTQPASAYGDEDQRDLQELADSIRNAWPDRFVEGMAPLYDPLSASPAGILPQYDNGDGVTLSPTGVQIVGNNLFKKLKAYFQPIIGVLKYTVDTSYNGTTWAQFDVVTDVSLVRKTYNRPRNGLIYFRVKALLSDSTFMTSRVGMLAPATTHGNDFMHRVLIDVGGNGVNTVNGSSVADGKLAPSPDSWGKTWNNWTGVSTGAGFLNGTGVANLVTTTNRPTPISVSITGNPTGNFGSTFTKAINYDGFKASVGDYPMEAVYDNMYIYRDSINYADGIKLRVRGLSKTNQYRIKLWGARIDNNTPVRVLESIQGPEKWKETAFIKKADTRYLTSQAADYNNAIVHNITGVDSVDILLRPSLASNFAHISVIDIGITGDIPLAPTLNIPDTTINLFNTSHVQLRPTVVDNGVPIYDYQWTQVSGPSSIGVPLYPTINADLYDLTNGVYVFRLTMVTAVGNISDDVKVTVLPNNGGKKTLRVHFSKTAAEFVPGWMNVFGEPGKGTSLPTLIGKLDPVTGWTVDNVLSGTANYWIEYAGSSSSNTEGHTTGNNSGIVPDIVLKGYWYNFTPYSTGKHNLRIGNLVTAKRYKITIVPSRSSTSTPLKFGCYRLNGGAVRYLNALGNTQNAVVFDDVAPDANGDVFLDIHSPIGVDTNTYGNFSFINGLIIQEL